MVLARLKTLGSMSPVEDCAPVMSSMSVYQSIYGNM